MESGPGCTFRAAADTAEPDPAIRSTASSSCTAASSAFREVKPSTQLLVSLPADGAAPWLAWRRCCLWEDIAIAGVSATGRCTVDDGV